MGKTYNSCHKVTVEWFCLVIHVRVLSYISSLLSHRRFSRSLRSSGQKLLTVPLAKLQTYGDRAFSTAAPRQWNNLPLSIRKSPSIAIFKRHLKTYLFKEANDF